MQKVAENGDIKAKWWDWHKLNPHIYKEFEYLTFQLIKNGVKKSSAWLVINQMRWNYAIQTKGDKFKISNDYIAYYTRLFQHYHPEHENFFTTKALKR